MKILALLAMLAFVVVGAVVGARLLLLARRTRQLPEFAVGLSLFSYSIFCEPLAVASRPIGMAFGLDARLAVLALALLANWVTVTGVYLFTFTVFRRGTAWGKAAVAFGSLVTVVMSVVLLSDIARQGAIGEQTLLTRACLAGMSLNFAACMAWTAAEAVRYHGLMRRRMALGLADPVVTNRFLVWGVGSAACAGLSLSLVVCSAIGLNLVVHPVPILLLSVCGLTAAICWMLSFLPPAAYLDWVRRRAPEGVV